MSTTPSHSMQSVTLQPGQSVSLLTGKVTNGTPLMVLTPEGTEVTVASRIDANDLQGLSDEFYLRATWGQSHLYL